MSALSSHPRQFRLVRPLAFGPASEVWVALVNGKEVIAKRYPPAYGPWPPPPDPLVLRPLNHRNIVRFLGSFVDADGVRVDLFRKLDGRTLGQMVRADGPINSATAWRCLTAGCRALRWIHAGSPVSPRIHGDVSPANVFVGNDGRIRLLDVSGLRPGERPSQDWIVGTLAMMAPEVLAGEAPGTASDVWSLAVTVLHGLLGSLPWGRARTPAEVLAAFASESPREVARKQVADRRLTEVLGAMLEPDPTARAWPEKHGPNG